jgi:hypothetical protein
MKKTATILVSLVSLGGYPMNYARKATLAASIDVLDMPEGAVASLAEVVRQHRAFGRSSCRR